MAGKMQLYYFPIRGLGEVPRLILVDQAVDFEDKRVSKDDWPTLKSTMQFGQMPCLKDGDFQLAQSGSINRYLAHKFQKAGLMGANDKEAAYIDMIYEGTVDLRRPYATMIYSTEFTDADKKKFLEETIPSELEKFEKLLASKDHGDHYFNGKNISYADYSVFEIIDAFLTLCSKVLDKCPKLKAFHDRVAARPHIKAYLASDRRKDVPINGNGKQ